MSATVDTIRAGRAEVTDMNEDVESRASAALLAYFAGESAFAVFDGICRQPLTRLAFLMLPGSWVGRQQTAEDVAQETLRQVAATLPIVEQRWDPSRGRLRTWLTTILRRRVINRMRRVHGPEAVATDCAPAGADDDEHSLEASQAAEGPGPPELAAFNEVLEALTGCVAALPKEWQEAVRLKFMEGLSQTEVAARLGVSSSSVSRWLEQAYPRLRDCLVVKGFSWR